MKSKEALEKLNNFIPREKHIDSERNKTINKCISSIKQDLERLEILDKLVTNDCIAGNEVGLQIVINLIERSNNYRDENEKLEKKNQLYEELVKELQENRSKLKILIENLHKEKKELYKQIKQLEKENEKLKKQLDIYAKYTSVYFDEETGKYYISVDCDFGCKGDVITKEEFEVLEND